MNWKHTNERIKKIKRKIRARLGMLAIKGDISKLEHHPLFPDIHLSDHAENRFQIVIVNFSLFQLSILR